MWFSRHKDAVAGVALVALAAGYLALSFQIRLTNIDKMVGSRVFPQICGVLLLLFGCGLVGMDLAASRKSAVAPDAAKAPASPKPVYRNTVLVLLSFALYIYLMEHIGFSISTVAYLLTQMLILQGTRPTWRNAILYAVISIAATAAIYFLFNNVFYLILPSGTLF